MRVGEFRLDSIFLSPENNSDFKGKNMKKARIIPSRKAAQMLGQDSPGVLATWRWRGVGPPYLKISNRVYYEVEQIEKWIVKHRVKTQEWNL